MRPIEKIKKLEPLVIEMLEKYPETKDNDNLLVLKIWAIQNPYLREANFTFIEFSHGLLEGRYASPDTITRSRRKLQRENPHLRGKLYKQRKELGDETRGEINN